MGPHADVQRGGAVPDEDFGAVLRGDPVIGKKLREAREQGGVLPHRFGELSVHREVRLGARRLDSDLAASAVINGAARGRVGPRGSGADGQKGRQEQGSGHGVGEGGGERYADVRDGAAPR